MVILKDELLTAYENLRDIYKFLEKKIDEGLDEDNNEEIKQKFKHALRIIKERV